MPERERVRLTLETAPSDVPAPVRLKRLMKALGRWYGWRCVEIEEVKPDGTDIGDQRGPQRSTPVGGNDG